jgi:hypothetical protein
MNTSFTKSGGTAYADLEERKTIRDRMISNARIGRQTCLTQSGTCSDLTNEFDFQGFALHVGEYNAPLLTVNVLNRFIRFSGDVIVYPVGTRSPGFSALPEGHVSF